MLLGHRWDMRSSNKGIMGRDKEDMDRREDIIMEGMRLDMDPKDSI